MEDYSYFNLHRKIFYSAIFQDAELFRLAVYLIGKARIKKGNVSLKLGKGQTILELKTGQLIFGGKVFGEFLNCNQKTIYNRVKKLEKLDFITCQPTRNYTVITIKNYEFYQNSEIKTTNCLPTDCTPITHRLPTDCLAITTNNNDNNINKENKDKKDDKKAEADYTESYLSKLGVKPVNSQVDNFIKSFNDVKGVFPYKANPSKQLSELILTLIEEGNADVLIEELNNSKFLKEKKNFSLTINWILNNKDKILAGEYRDEDKNKKVEYDGYNIPADHPDFDKHFKEWCSKNIPKSW